MCSQINGSLTISTSSSLGCLLSAAYSSGNRLLLFFLCLFPKQRHTWYSLTLIMVVVLSMCLPVSATQRRHGLRSAVRRDLEVPRCNLAIYGQKTSFNVSGPSLWNSLPLTVRDSSLTVTQFCTRLKTFLFTRTYGTSS